VVVWFAAIAGVANAAAPTTAEPRRNFLRFRVSVMFPPKDFSSLTIRNAPPGFISGFSHLTWPLKITDPHTQALTAPVPQPTVDE
jgi:hypothetical protein